MVMALERRYHNASESGFLAEVSHCYIGESS